MGKIIVVQTGLDFGQALIYAKQGALISREGWNGKGMFVFQRPFDSIPVDVVVDTVKSLPHSVKKYYDNFRNEEGEPTRLVEFNAYLCMKAANEEIVNGWLASQTDMLANDWCVVEASTFDKDVPVGDPTANAWLPEGSGQVFKDTEGESKPMEESQAAIADKDPLLDVQVGLTQFREQLDADATVITSVLNMFDCMELHEAKRSLVLARCWAGKLLGFLGKPSPYSNEGSRQTVADIEPEADKAIAVGLSPRNEGESDNDYLTRVVDGLRQTIGGYVADGWGKTTELDRAYYTINPNAAQYAAYAHAKDALIQHLSEARFFLGFTLGVVRDLFTPVENTDHRLG